VFGFSFSIPHFPDRAETLLEAATAVRLAKPLCTSTAIEARNPQQGIAEASGRRRRKTRLEYLG